MKEYKEEDYLMLSGLQHFTFCRRQWALIHIEQQWQDNLRTVEGEHLHNLAHDDAIRETRGDLIVTRGLHIFSRSLGVSGSCDVVEFRRDVHGVTLFGREGTFRPIPIEYKRGQPKEHDADLLQLTAQAMCLKEMLSCDIREGYLYYGEIRRRVKVVFSEELQDRVRKMCEEMHALYDRRYTPKVRRSKACNACSLKNLCLPKLCGNLSAGAYIERSIKACESS